MNIRFLGAHNAESRQTAYASLLIDGVLAIDAGALTRGLSLPEQYALQAIVLTHRHYDHVRDLPALAINLYSAGRSIDIYSSQEVRDAALERLFDGVLYPNFLARPPEAPTLHHHPLRQGRPVAIAGYAVLPLAVPHGVPATAYQINRPGGRKLFYTGDTGPGLGRCWEQTSPDLLITEVTLPNDQEETARAAGHLTPALLKVELEAFRQLHGYLPQTVITHVWPDAEEEIARQVADVAEALNCPITIAHEGMVLVL